MELRIKELLVMWLTFGGALLWVGGIIDVAFTPVPVLGVALALLGLAMQGAALVVSRRMDTLHTIGKRTSGGVEYDKLRYQARLRGTGLTLNALAVLAVVVLAAGAYVRLSDAILPGDLGPRVAFVLSLAIGAATALGLYESLRSPEKLKKSWLRDLFSGIFLGAAVVAAMIAVLAATRPGDAFGSRWLLDGDVQMLLLAGQAAIAWAILIQRDMPTFYSLFRADPGAESGDASVRTRNIILPTLAAFALLFILVLVVLAYGIGLADVLGEVGQNPVVLGLLGLLVGIIAAVIYLAVKTGASQDQAPPLIRRLVSDEVRRENILVLVSGLTAVLVIGFGIMIRADLIPFIPSRVWFDIIGFGVLVAIGPFGFYAAYKHKRTRLMEDRFPDFLRDLASSHRGGLTLYSAVAVAARGDYGALTPEVRKMADQLSWHVPFEEALRRFAQRVKTPLVERSVNLILEASRSGGHTTDVLLAAARDAREIKNLENDRRISMTVYTIVVYVTFLVFLLVASILYARFVPQILATSAAAAELGGQTEFGGVSFSNNLGLEDYRVFYFTAALVQGLGDGIIAGLMGSGRAVLGLRHSFWMVLIAWLTFVFFI